MYIPTLASAEVADIYKERARREDYSSHLHSQCAPRIADVGAGEGQGGAAALDQPTHKRRVGHSDAHQVSARVEVAIEGLAALKHDSDRSGKEVIEKIRAHRLLGPPT